MSNFFYKIDFLSPPITLFHLERRTHTSNIGGCSLRLMLSIITAYVSFLLYDLICHKKLTTLFHKKFEFEAGYYSFNSSSIFHFIQIFSPENGGYFDKYDSQYIRAYTTYVRSNFSYGNLYLYDHWVFDICRKNIDDKGLDPHLFDNVENFTNSVCIRYFYNSTKRKYFSIEDKDFSWPYLEHGISQRSNIYLTTIIQKCSNDSVINEIFGQCPSQKEIDDYISKYFAIYLYFTDTQIDPANYTDPVTKYLQVISTGIGTPQTYVESYIHFSPVRIRTNLGSLFGRTDEINSFYFDFNRKGAANNGGEKYYTITRYYHLMQNNVQIYERKYNNIFDLFSEIGGVVQFIFYLFYWMNFFYNKYIIAYNTNSLFFSIGDSKLTDKNKSTKKICKYLQNKIIESNQKVFNVDNNNNIIIDDTSKCQGNQKMSNFYISNFNLNKNIYSNVSNGNINLKDDPEVNKIIEKPIPSKFKKIIDLKQIKSDKNKNIFHTNFNSSHVLLKENSNLNSFMDQIKNKKEFNSYCEKYNNLDINKKGDNNDTKKRNFSSKEYINRMCLSKESIAKIEHIEHLEKKSNNTLDEKIRKIKHFSFIHYIKSFVFKADKERRYFLSTFRKHLLSEEHLLKSHIKMIFLEKQHNIGGEENTNVLECFNEL